MKQNEIITFKDGSTVIRPLNSILLIEPSGKIRILKDGKLKVILETKERVLNAPIKPWGYDASKRP